MIKGETNMKYNFDSILVYMWRTFEQAPLCAVSIKLTGRENATE